MYRMLALFISLSLFVCSCASASPAPGTSAASGRSASGKSPQAEKIQSLPSGFESAVSDLLARRDFLGAVEAYESAAGGLPPNAAAQAPGTAETLERVRASIGAAVRGISLTPVSSPPATVSGSPFKAPFSAELTGSEGTVLPGMPVEAEVPSFGEDGTVGTEALSLTTGEDGRVSWTPPVPPRSVEGAVRFSLALRSKDALLDSALREGSGTGSLSMPFLAGTRNKSVPTSIALLDFDKNGKPLGGMGVSATECLKPLVKMGFSRIGMADFPNQLASGDEDALIAAAKKLFGSSVERLIYGTTKVSSTSQGEDGAWTAVCATEVSVWSFKQGAKTWSGSVEASGTGKTESQAISAARSAAAGKALPLKLYYNL